MSDGTYAVPTPVTDPVELAALRDAEDAHRELTAAVRDLVDLCVRTTVSPETLREATTAVRELNDRLGTSAHPAHLGLQAASDGRLRDHGNPAVGWFNPIAPPLVVRRDPDARATSTEFEVGAAYEGPPGHLHGGMIALVLDQVLGTVPAVIGRPGLTAYLNVTYRLPSRLGRFTSDAWCESSDGRKTLVRGRLMDAEGRTTAEAEAMFIIPKSMPELTGRPTGDAGEFDPD